MPKYQAGRQDLFSNVGSPQQPLPPAVDVPSAIEALTGGAASLIHSTMLRKQAEFARQHQAAQEDIARQHWNQTAEWHAGEVARESARDAETAAQNRRLAITRGWVPGQAADPGTPDTSATIAPSAANVTPNAPGQFSDQPPVNPVLKAMTRGSVQGAPQVSAPALTPGYSKTGTPTPSPSTVTAPGRPATAATPDSYDQSSDRDFQRATGVAQLGANSRIAVENTRAAAAKALESERQVGRLKIVQEQAKTKDPTKIRASMADDILDNYAGGDRAKAEEWIKEHPEHGVTSDDMFAAEGRARTATQKRIAAKTAGPRGRTPAEAQAEVTEEDARRRGSVGGSKGTPGGMAGMRGAPTATPTAPAPTAPPRLGKPAAPTTAKPVDESALSDADLWEQKVQSGMSKEQATAYVKGRKKP